MTKELRESFESIKDMELYEICTGALEDLIVLIEEEEGEGFSGSDFYSQNKKEMNICRSLSCIHTEATWIYDFIFRTGDNLENVIKKLPEKEAIKANRYKRHRRDDDTDNLLDLFSTVDYCSKVYRFLTQVSFIADKWNAMFFGDYVNLFSQKRIEQNQSDRIPPGYKMSVGTLLYIVTSQFLLCGEFLHSFEFACKVKCPEEFQFYENEISILSMNDSDLFRLCFHIRENWMRIEFSHELCIVVDAIEFAIARMISTPGDSEMFTIPFYRQEISSLLSGEDDSDDDSDHGDDDEKKARGGKKLKIGYSDESLDHSDSYEESNKDSSLDDDDDDDGGGITKPLLYKFNNTAISLISSVFSGIKKRLLYFKKQYLILNNVIEKHSKENTLEYIWPSVDELRFYYERIKELGCSGFQDSLAATMREFIFKQYIHPGVHEESKLLSLGGNTDPSDVIEFMKPPGEKRFIQEYSSLKFSEHIHLDPVRHPFSLPACIWTIVKNMWKSAGHSIEIEKYIFIEPDKVIYRIPLFTENRDPCIVLMWNEYNVVYRKKIYRTKRFLTAFALFMNIFMFKQKMQSKEILMNMTTFIEKMLGQEAYSTMIRKLIDSGGSNKSTRGRNTRKSSSFRRGGEKNSKNKNRPKYTIAIHRKNLKVNTPKVSSQAVE